MRSDNMRLLATSQTPCCTARNPRYVPRNRSSSISFAVTRSCRNNPASSALRRVCTGSRPQQQQAATAAAAAGHAPCSNISATKSSSPPSYDHRATEYQLLLAGSSRARRHTSIAAAGNANDAGSVATSTATCSVLAAEFGSAALQLLNLAAALAAQECNTEANGAASTANSSNGGSSSSSSSSSGSSAPSAAEAKPPGTASSIPASATCLTVTEQHLLLALLQQHPEALQLLGEHMVVDRGAAAAAAKQYIADKLSSLPRSISISSGDSGTDAAAKASTSVTVRANSSYDVVSASRQSGEVEFSTGLLAAMSSSLNITRRAGLPCITWPGLMWGLMAAPDAYKCFEPTLGVRLYSGDLAEQLEKMVSAKTATATAQVPSDKGRLTAVPAGSSSSSSSQDNTSKDSGDPSGSSSNGKPGTKSSKAAAGAGSVSAADDVAADLPSTNSTWLDAMLDTCLHDAALSAAAGRNIRAVLSLCAAMTAASSNNFRPTNSWLTSAWEVLDQAMGPYSTSNSDVATAVHGAAYASVKTFAFSSPALENAFQKVQPEFPTEASGGNTTNAWLQWLCVGYSLGGSTWTAVADQAQQHMLISGNAQQCSAAISRDGQHNRQVLCEALFPLAMASTSTRQGDYYWHKGWGIVWDKLGWVARSVATSAPASCSMHVLAACAVVDPAVRSGQISIKDHNDVRVMPEDAWHDVARDVLKALIRGSTAGRMDAISAAQLTEVYASLAAAASLSNLPCYYGLLDAAIIRLKQLSLPETALLAAAALSGGTASFSFKQLSGLVAAAAAAVPVMSIQQLQLYLQAVEALNNHPLAVRVLASSTIDKPSEEQQQVMAILQNLFEQQLPANTMSIILAALAAEKLSAETVSTISSILHSLEQLPVFLPAAALEQFQLQFAKLAPLLQPAEIDCCVAFLAKHQLQGGKRLGHAVTSTAAVTAAVAAAAPTAPAPSAYNGTMEDPSVAYCTSLSTEEVDKRAAAAAAALRLAARDKKALVLPVDGRQQLGGAAANVSQVLCDMAQALGASSLPVEPAVVDVLAAYVDQAPASSFTAQQLVMLVWAFARKQPSAAAAGAIGRLVNLAVAVCADSDGPATELSSKEVAVCKWAADKLQPFIGSEQ